MRTIHFFVQNRAISYTLSALIMTVTTVSLVLAASIYAYQVLDQQRGSAEFQVAVKSILAFDDALENVALKTNGTLSSRFTVQYGELRIIPETSSGANTIQVYADVGGSDYELYSGKSCLLSYYLKNSYVNYGEGYKSYILGDESALLCGICGSTGSYGRAVVMQHSGWVNVTLDFRVRAMLTSRILDTMRGRYVNYVDVWVIRTEVHPSLRSYSYYAYLNDFDLKARSLSVETISKGPYVPVSGSATLDVTVGKTMSTCTFSIASAEDVMFNVIVARVQVYA